ncbi:MAG: hypothetical protein WCD42_02890 [Rhizomicrobium sp.]
MQTQRSNRTKSATTARQDKRRLIWAIPALLAIYPISQACGYAVGHGGPSWLYVWPVLYCFAVMAAVLASFARAQARHDSDDMENHCRHNHDGFARLLLIGLAVLLVVWCALVPLLRDIQLPNPELMRRLHYVLSLCDAVFAFLVLVGTIDLCSGIFFDSASYTEADEDRITACRNAAVKTGYIIAVFGMGALYLIGQYQPQWSMRLILPLIALTVAVPVMHFVRRLGRNQRGD